MASKSSSPGPNPTTTPSAKQARSRKAAPPNTDTGRAGSAGGIVLEKEKEKEKAAKPKNKPISSTTTTSKATSSQDAPADTQSANKTTRRKPRKLNKDPAPTTTTTAAPSTASATKAPAEPPTATDIEALKSRVRGLEAKVEELYKNGTVDRSGRSPRRRGKGRKSSSQQQVPTLGGSSSNQAHVIDDDDEIEEIGRGDGDAVDELVRLEGELEVARRDLDAVRPRRRKTTATDGTDDVEDIPRDDPNATGNRHVTLSGSYRIPLPSSVSVDDVRQIQSGVSAAQNVARSFLEQRRAAAIKNQPSSSQTQAQSPGSKKTSKHAAAARPSPKSVSSSLEITPVDDGTKQSWGEWIGGYSMAISRAVQSIEHEAAVESQRTDGAGKGSRRGGAGSGAAGKAKRPGVKTKLSGEQVDGLMS